MRLLVCTYEYPPHYSSGAGNVAYYVVNQLRKMGVDCTVCSPTGPDIILGSNSLIARYGCMGLLDYWHQVGRYFRRSTDGYDMAWLHNPMFIKNSPFKRSLITMHVTYYGVTICGIYPLHLRLYYKISSKLEKHSLGKINPNSTKFTAVSPHVLEELEKIGIDSKNITYIPNGVDTQRFKPSVNKKELRKKFNLPEDDVILLSLGRLTEAKQPYKLIEVFSLAEKSMKDITLVIAGGGELLEKTKKLVQKKGLTRVKFLGYVDHERDVPDLYTCSDYYIMTPKYEGQPLTLLEAMASGLPCIVSDIPALRIVEEARCGIIIDFNSVERAANQITQYLGRDNSDHSRDAREYAVSNLDWEIIAGRYLGEFEKLR